jgi:ligand-binding sensor domain-containing protein/signal transduction histidine kinase
MKYPDNWFDKQENNYYSRVMVESRGSTTRHWNSSIAIIILLVTMSIQAIGQQIVFNKVFPSDGSTFSFVSGITQDNNGYMWFATKRGLYSYDGTQMVSYKSSSLSANSLASNLAESIFADDDGSIWVGSLGTGLDHFDQFTGAFTHFQHDPDDPASLSNDTVTSILRDRDGILWIGTHQGLDQFNPETKEFIHFRHRENDPASLSSNQVRVIYEDKQGTLWIGTGSPFAGDGGGVNDGGLNRLEKTTGQFTRYMHNRDDINSLISNKVSAIFEDNQGAFWVGTRGGLHKMNRQEGTFERLVHDPAHPEKFSGPIIVPENADWDHITFIHQDAAGSYWYGTVANGLYYFNPALDKMIRYHASGNTSEEFSDNGAWSAYTSRDGMLWIGTAQGNIFRINPLQTKIPYFAVSGGSASAFYEEPDGTFWVGTNQGLIRQDKTTGNSESILIDANPASPDNSIHYIYGNPQGHMWVGGSGGLSRWDKKNEKFIRYKNEPVNNNSLSNNSVYAIFEDKESGLWIGTGSGLNLLNKQTGTFKRFNTSLFVTAVYEDNSGNLWVGTWYEQGIFQFNKETGELINNQAGVNVTCFFEDYENVLWVGTTQGLLKYDPGAERFIVVSDLYSIVGMSEIIGIKEDNQKNLWIACAEGIIRINPERSSSRIFGKEYGVGENVFVYLASYKGLNGELYFGDTNGYFAFNPADFNDHSNPPEVVITNFYLANQSVKPGKGSLLKESLLQTKSISLRSYQKSFSFDFAVIDYKNPESNRLFFMMENYDQEWRGGGFERRAYYFNLPSGKYTFRVKGANSSGIWAERTIDIIILPPWWRTWWAYIIYAIIFITAIFGIDRFQRRRLLDAEREKTRERELLHAKEIEKAYTELKTTQVQLIQAEKMASLGELTAGIAHEIQNPLNFVNNFSEISNELIEEMKGERIKDKGERDEELEGEILNDISQNLEKILHHGKRADAIVKGMLQHSRTSTGQKEPTDINALADEYLRLSYHGLRAKDKSFNADYKTDFDPNLPKVEVIPQDIGRVLLNLINNAFYAVSEKQKSPMGSKTPSGLDDYKPAVTITTKNLGDKIEISVKDNGPGIPEEIKNKIFQPFFTTKPTGQGTGLGLSLSYDIVKVHGGELKVGTIEKEETNFSIVLPI